MEAEGIWDRLVSDPNLRWRGSRSGILPATGLGRLFKSESIKAIVRKFSVLWVVILAANVICVGALQNENAVLAIPPEAKPSVQHVLPSSDRAE